MQAEQHAGAGVPEVRTLGLEGEGPAPQEGMLRKVFVDEQLRIGTRRDDQATMSCVHVRACQRTGVTQP
jgi:hypothetical protein